MDDKANALAKLLVSLDASRVGGEWYVCGESRLWSWRTAGSNKEKGRFQAVLITLFESTHRTCLSDALHKSGHSPSRLLAMYLALRGPAIKIIRHRPCIRQLFLSRRSQNR